MFFLTFRSVNNSSCIPALKIKTLSYTKYLKFKTACFSGNHSCKYLCNISLEMHVILFLKEWETSLLSVCLTLVYFFFNIYAQAFSREKKHSTQLKEGITACSFPPVLPNNNKTLFRFSCSSNKKIAFQIEFYSFL